MKKAIFTIFILFMSVSSSAQNWTKDTVMKFCKSVQVTVIVDISNAEICGVSYSDFPAYYAKENNTDEEHASLVLKHIVDTFQKTFHRYNYSPELSSDDASFIVHYDFNKISKKGGFNGTMYVTMYDDRSAVVPFKAKKGYGFGFEYLVMETIDFYFQDLHERISRNPGYVEKLCKYK